tara:strand:- start:30481 stop:30828 length:348 start_codon:yes stop_codon:yes gene_type:complete
MHFDCLGFVGSEMESENQTLLEALNQLKTAIEQQDWETAEKLDAGIKEGIASAVLNAKSDEDKHSLTDLLKRVQSLYGLLISNTEESRRKISVELKKITNDKKVANFYLKSAQYK